MAYTYTQIVKQIESLRRKADSARKKEVSGVITRIKEAIKFYDLSADELGFGGGRAGPSVSAPAGARKRKAGAPKSKSKFGDAAKYRDANGNEWVGRGPRPIWLRQAIASGKSLADFAIGGEAPASVEKKVSRKARSKRAKRTPVAKYKDASGKTWSGRGRRPGWFVKALAEGKAPESMAA
jgi:DNA-binding protein H-NS